MVSKLRGRTRWPDEKLISRACAAKTDTSYWDNINELRRRASASLYSRCQELTGSERPVERIVGINVLSDLYLIDKKKKYGIARPYQKEVLRLFIEMIAKETHPEAIAALLYGIGHNNRYMKNKEINSLLPFIYSDDKNIRLAARSALSGKDSMTALRGLIELSKDRSSCIRDWATFAIGTLSDLDNDAIRTALYARCTDRHHNTRMEAIYGLAKRKDERVKQFIEKEFDACTVYVLESIRDLDAKEYLPRLEAILAETETKPDHDVNQYWLSCLKECVEKLRSE